MVKRFGVAGIVLLATAVAAPRADDGSKTYPAHVLIIRHGEKPPEEAMSPDLTAEGKDRAEALPKLFVKAVGRPDPFPTPDFIFAARDSDKSRRSTETVAPLAKALGLKVNADIGSNDFAQLAHDLMHDPRYAGKTVLVCWHHGKIPALAGKLQVVGVPDPWDAHLFDRVWQIDYDQDGKATFADRPQRLMPKDSEK